MVNEKFINLMKDIKEKEELSYLLEDELQSLEGKICEVFAECIKNDCLFEGVWEIDIDAYNITLNPTKLKNKKLLDEYKSLVNAHHSINELPFWTDGGCQCKLYLMNRYKILIFILNADVDDIESFIRNNKMTLVKYSSNDPSMRINFDLYIKLNAKLQELIGENK